MKYFIDCGTHFFQGLQAFDRRFNFDAGWSVFSFEANPITYARSREAMPERLKSIRLTHLNRAVSDRNGTVLVNCDFSEAAGVGQGSNILANPPKTDAAHGITFSWSTTEVECFDLAEFIHGLSDLEFLAIKLDVEGSEFSILWNLIEKGAYRKVDEFHIEFHERFFVDELETYARLKQAYIDFLRASNIEVVTWT